MEYARAELRFVGGGWSREVLVEGAAQGRTRRALMNPDGLQVVLTLLAPTRRAPAPPGVKRVGDSNTATPPQLVAFSRGAAVLQRDRRIGTVTALWCDNATGTLRHALVSPGGALGGRRAEYVLDARWIQGVASNRLLLSADAPALDSLIPYRPDAALEHDAHSALAQALPNATARRGVKYFVQEGALHLGGLVETDEDVARARGAVAGLVGLRSLTVDLVSMESLAERVERQLGLTLTAAESTVPDLRILTEHGIVYLEGTAPSADVAAALERTARSVPGARVVLNHLAVRE